MRRVAPRILNTPGWFARGVRAFHADRKKHFHAFNSAAYSGCDFCLRTFDLRRGDLAAFKHAVSPRKDCRKKQIWATKGWDFGRLSVQDRGPGGQKPCDPRLGA